MTEMPVAAAPGLSLVRATSLAALADELVRRWAVPPEDPFTSDLAIVPGAGVRRWLGQRIATSAGICAGVEFKSFGAIETGLFDGVAAWWEPESTVWTLHRLVGDQPELAQLRRHLDATGEPYTPLRLVARRFVRYAEFRPAMVAAWRDGRDVDVADAPLGENAWQAHLWRELRAATGGDPNEAHAELCERLGAKGEKVILREVATEPSGTRARSGVPEAIERPFVAGSTPAPILGADGRCLSSGLPPRIAVFTDGMSARRWTLLEALAHSHQVDVFLSTGAPARWPEASIADPRRREYQPRPGHPLALALGRQADEAAAVVPPTVTGLGSATRRVGTGQAESETTQTTEAVLADPAPPDTLLGWLQADLLADADPKDVPPRVLRPDDRSVQLLLSHGLDRQVDVLRDAMARLLSENPDLEPRDIVIVTPDPDRVAALVAAGFGAVPQPRNTSAWRADERDKTEDVHPAHGFRVQVSDRSLAQANPAVALLTRLLRLPDTRMTASDLIDLTAEPLVARRFGFPPQDHERLADLIRHAGVRWGLNAAHRASFGLRQFPQSTWVDGLQRLLLGVALSGDELVYAKTTLPVDDVDSSDVALLGGLAEFVARVGRMTQSFGTPASVPGWTARCREALAALAETGPGDAWQLSALWAGLARIEDRWDDASTATVTRRTALRLIEDEFTSRTARATFGNGSAIICGPDALRHVPHPVVCLLGWDAPVYPRRARDDGDDLMAADPRLGDPSAALRDRQGLLDAVRAATRALVVVAQGRDAVTNQPVPLASPIEDLLAALDATARTAEDVSAGAAVTVQFPLQPFSPRCYAGRDDVPRSFDPVNFRTARARIEARNRPVDETDAVPVLPPPDPGESVALDDLVAFFKHPAKYWLRTRTGLVAGRDESDPDQLPLELDGLRRWAVGNRMLRHALAGLPPERVVDAERRSGDIPPGEFGRRIVTSIVADIDRVMRRLPPVAKTAPDVRDFAIDLTLPGPSASHGPATVRVTGRVDVHDRLIVGTEFSKLQSRHRLTAWVRLAALAAAEPGPWRAVVVTPSRTCALAAPPDAPRVLADLVAIYRHGLTRVVPAPPRVNEAWASLRRERQDLQSQAAEGRLAAAWDYDQDDAWKLFYDQRRLFDQPADPDLGVGPAEEKTMQGRLARAIWDDLLASEVTP